MEFDGFDWDDGNRTKCQRHGLSLHEIEDVFLSGPVDLYPDEEHSLIEERIKAIGRTNQGRHCLIVFTMRERDGQTRLRPISARYMHKKEIAWYEQAVARPEN